jgi:hypothetical protein
MNKRLVLVIFLTLAAITAISVWLVHLSYQPVTFNIKQTDVTSLTVYSSDGKTKAGSLSGSGKLSLKNGKYTVVPAGGNVNTDSIAFTVNGPTTVDIAPGYSGIFLDQLLAPQINTLHALIVAKYPTIATAFDLASGKLYQDGNWYATTLAQKPARGQFGDVYRLVMHKTGDTWTFETKPQLVLAAKDYPKVPHTVLSDINQQTGY